MKIMLYGSAFMTQIAEAALIQAGHTIVGYVPNKSARFPGQMTSPLIFHDEIHDLDYDIALSVLYDRKIFRLENTYNIHPALLPWFGGVNCSFWALRYNAQEFGWTCHAISEHFDKGPIVARLHFPIIPGIDDNASLFIRQARVLPDFAVAAVKVIGETQQYVLPFPGEGTYYPRSWMDHQSITPEDKASFAADGEKIARYVKEMQR